MFKLIVDLMNETLDFLEDILNLVECDFTWDEGGRLVVDDLDKALYALKGFNVTVL